MRATTCWVCGANASSSLCTSCADRARNGGHTFDATPIPTVADPDITQPVPVVTMADFDRPRRRPFHWAWNNRRGLLGGVVAGGVSVLLLLGISFGWADATDRASQLEHTVTDRDKALERAERRLAKSKKEQRKMTKKLGEAATVNNFLDALYRGTQADLQQVNGQVSALQAQLAATSIQVFASRACLDSVLAVSDTRGQANRNAALSQALASNC